MNVKRYYTFLDQLIPTLIKDCREDFCGAWLKTQILHCAQDDGIWFTNVKTQETRALMIYVFHSAPWG